MIKDTKKDTDSIDCIDLHALKKDSLNYPRNPLINSMRNKISDIREVSGKLQLDYFVFSETKLIRVFLWHNLIFLIMK